MTKILKNKYLVTIFRVLFATIFIFAGIEKIADPESFAVSIENYRLVPIWSVNFFAILIPWIEVVAGILLLFGYQIKDNMILLNGLLIIFTIMIIIAVLRGLDINCGCFGTKHAQKVGLYKIIENCITIAIGFIVYYFPNNSFKFLKDDSTND